MKAGTAIFHPRSWARSEICPTIRSAWCISGLAARSACKACASHSRCGAQPLSRPSSSAEVGAPRTTATGIDTRRGRRNALDIAGGTSRCRTNSLVTNPGAAFEPPHREAADASSCCLLLRQLATPFEDLNIRFVTARDSLCDRSGLLTDIIKVTLLNKRY